MQRAIAIALGAGLIAGAAGPAGAGGDTFNDDEPEVVLPAVKPIGDGVLLVGKDAEWRWKAITAPRLDRQIGAVAIAGLDLMLGRRKVGVVFTGPDLTAPDGWPLALGAGAAPGPFAAADDDGTCDCATRLTYGETERIAALYTLTGFSLAKDHEDLRVLELRMRYRDGLVVWLNGVEVIRRGLSGTAGDKLATRSRGPEWEIFRIPAAPGLLREGANRLAIEVRPSGRSRSPLLDVELVGRRKHGIARGPMVQRVGATTATIVVETELDATATLHWGQGHATDHELASPAGHRHEFELTGLDPHGLVTYRVDAGDDRTEPIAFHTAPGPDDALRIAVYGDVRGGHATHRALIEAIEGEAPDLLVATGDLVLRGTDEGDWQRFFAVVGDLITTVPYYPVVGNHDHGRTGEDRRSIDEIFALPPAPTSRPVGTYWYSFDVSNVHFVFLDSDAYDRLEQRDWLDADLADARRRDVRAIILAVHDGPYSRGSHRGNTQAQRDYVPVMNKYGVDLLLAGHDHLYQRGSIGGLSYIVSGGGGASLYSVACGLPGKRKCKVEDGMQFTAKEHHYVMVTIDHGRLETCARRADGTLLEPCVRQKLIRKR